MDLPATVPGAYRNANPHHSAAGIRLYGRQRVNTGRTRGRRKRPVNVRQAPGAQRQPANTGPREQPGSIRPVPGQRDHPGRTEQAPGPRKQPGRTYKTRASAASVAGACVFAVVSGAGAVFAGDWWGQHHGPS